MPPVRLTPGPGASTPAMPPPRTGPGASTPGEDLGVAIWNVGMADGRSPRDVKASMDTMMDTIQELVCNGVDIIGLNGLHPKYFAFYDRAITFGFGTRTCHMRFLGVEPGDALVWRAICRASFASGGVQKSSGRELAGSGHQCLCVCVCVCAGVSGGGQGT